MAFITLRQANVVNSPNAIIKNFPLIDSEVDNNFANLNLEISNLSNLISTSSGNVVVAGNIIPFTSNVYDIGSPDKVVRDLWLSGNSLHLGALTLSVVSGNVALGGTQVLTSLGALPADNSVTTAKILASAVTEAKIADNSVTEDKIAADSVTSTKIFANAVTQAKIANDSITENKILNLAVSEAKLAANAVTETKIGSSAVTETKIGSSAVTEAKIASNAITNTKIAANAVLEEKINNLAVTEAKIASGAVTETKIGTNAVSEAKIASGAVTNSKLADLAVNTSKLSNNLSLTYSTLNTPFERANIANQAAPSTITYDLLNQTVLYFTSNSTSNVTINFRGNATTTVNNMLTNTSNTISAVLLLTNGATPYYVNAVQIDGVVVHSATARGNLFWQGNTLQVGGYPVGIDSYGFTIVKRGNAQYIILGSQTQFASSLS